MKKPILKVILFSLLLLVITSLLSYMFYNMKIENGYKVGFPFVYYSEFQLSGNDYRNFGWFPYHGIYNALIYLAASILFFKIRAKK
ncbi:MAG: hypothetical protein ABJL44_01390 [Algibacter sp.]